MELKDPYRSIMARKGLHNAPRISTVAPVTRLWRMERSLGTHNVEGYIKQHIFLHIDALYGNKFLKSITRIDVRRTNRIADAVYEQIELGGSS